MTTLYVAGDATDDQYVYVTSQDALSPSLREAWVHADQLLSVTTPGSAGGVPKALKALSGPGGFDVTFLGEKDFRPESLYLLYGSKPGGKDSKARRWSIQKSFVTGQEAARKETLKQHPAPDPEVLGLTKKSGPLVIIDFNQGWVARHREVLKEVLKDRTTLIRTDDPSASEWQRLRQALPDMDCTWFSPLQDLAGGSLRAPGTWPSVRNRIVEHLSRDETLCREGVWLQDIVIQVEGDGVLVLRREGARAGELYIFPQAQPGSLSREGQRGVLGSGMVMVASLAQELVRAPGGQWKQRELARAARHGGARLRALVRSGYPSPEDIKSADDITHLFPAALQRPPESLDEQMEEWKLQQADYDSAEQVAIGREDAFRKRTVLSLGALVTADEEYAGALLGLLSRLEGHLERGKKVLSFSIFGGPGSGKSFVAKQLADVLDPERAKFETVECNLSQLDGPERLTEVFRKVVQVGLRQKTPLVIFDEFDSALRGTPRAWLPYFLMPMQDGTFFDGAEARPQPLPDRCVFVFVGGTFRDGVAFKKWALEEGGEGSKLKGRDFHSRLDRSLDIPDLELVGAHPLQVPLAQGDLARLRRAILLRHWFKKDFQTVSQIEKGVLAWLLQVPLAHGTRSLEGILKASELGRTREFRAHHLPSREMLQLHLRDPLEEDFIRKFMRSAGASEAESPVLRRLEFR
jgi:hypothetical protein